MTVYCNFYCPDKKYVHFHSVQHNKIKCVTTSVRNHIDIDDIGEAELMNVYMINEDGRLEQEEDVYSIEVS